MQHINLAVLDRQNLLGDTSAGFLPGLPILRCCSQGSTAAKQAAQAEETWEQGSPRPLWHYYRGHATEET